MDPLDAPRIWVEKLHEGVGCRSRECATAQSSCDDEAYSQEIEISGYSCFSSASSLSDVDEVLWDAGTLKAAANGLERRGNGRGSSSTYFTHRTCEVGGAGERSREHDKRRWEVGAIASEMAMLQLAAGGGEAWAAWGDAECYSSSGSESQDENQVQNWGPRAARRSEKGRSRAGEEAVRWVNNATYFFNMSDVQHEHQWELQQGRRAAAVSGPSAVASRAVAVIIAAEQGEQPRGRCGEGQAAGSWGVPGEELRQAPEQNIPLFDWESTNPLYYAPPLCSEQPAQPEPADRHCPVPAAEACLAAPSASSERAQLPRYARRTWKPPTAAPQQLRPSPSSTRYAASGRRLAKPASRVAVPVAHQDHSCLLVEQRVDFAATNTRVASVETKAAVCPVIPAEQRSGDGVAVLPHGNSTAQTAAAGAVAQQRPAAVEMLGVEAAEQLQEAVRLCTDAARYGTPYGDAGDGCDVVESPAAASCPLPQHGTAPLDLGLHRLRPSGAHDVGVEAEPVRAVLSSDVAPRVPSCELETSSNPAYSCEKPPRADRSVSHCFGAAPAAARMVRLWVSCFRPPPGGGVRD